ncbi:MAG TPA: hypothetical protein VGL27_17755 [Negativicutes bacterium]
MKNNQEFYNERVNRIKRDIAFGQLTGLLSGLMMPFPTKAGNATLNLFR